MVEKLNGVCYFGKVSRSRVLSGHHAGVFVGLFTYDIKLGEVGAAMS